MGRPEYVIKLLTITAGVKKIFGKDRTKLDICGFGGPPPFVTK
jgi:hypothetical protein